MQLLPQSMMQAGSPAGVIGNSGQGTGDLGIGGDVPIIGG